MPVFWIFLIVVALALVGYVIGRQRAVASAGGDSRILHSRPSYYGWNVFLFAAAPAIAVMLAWMFLQPIVVKNATSGVLEREQIAAGIPPAQATLALREVERLALGLDQAVARGVVTREEAATLNPEQEGMRARLQSAGVALTAAVTGPTLIAAQEYRRINSFGSTAMTVVVLGLALAGFAWAILNIKPDYRARNSVELVIRLVLIGCSLIAIVTTLAIVFSLVFETGNFFSKYPWQSFFFGTTWAPNFRGNSQLGMLPLLWGTLYISFIALLVAVPIGLFSAIYMSEYAGPRLRSIVKPAIEVLAGIPTIVYGLFALVTVGPMLRDYFAQPLGLGNSGSSVMTAGLVMGIMIIPFVSSLSDDIINAVPQSLRDGSLAMGATPSETIRQVVLPAALPGIVGAVLLAASRAIGETMIVVMGAGAAARMSMNPFEAMTTITSRIVSQLTGDGDFAAPETLVAFALGLTLFVLTLAMNVLALYIVRKYREQYE